MPKIKYQDIQNMEYVSMTDFSDKFDQFETFQEKLTFTTKYLLASRNYQGQKDYTFEESLHIARLKLAGESKKLKDGLRPEHREHLRRTAPQTVNPNEPSVRQENTNQYFFGDPKSYMLRHTFPLDDQRVLDGVFTADAYVDLVENNLNERIKNIERNSNALDVRFRMEERIGSRRDVEQAYNATKRGFFSRMFSGDSRAYKNFETVYKAFNNPNHAMFGDLNSLETSTNQYLEHKIPGWKPGNPIPEDIYTRFNSTEVARIRFCANINATIKEQRESAADFKEMVQACEAQNYKSKDLDLPDEPVAQQDFQNQLGENLVEENQNEFVEENEHANEKQLDDSENEGPQIYEYED